MAVTKRARYEVLKRDNQTCRYCRATDNPLTVDHVIPVALGGSDKPNNLVAACKDCNAGKASTSPTEESVAQVGEDDMRWASAVKRAAEHMVAELADKDERLDWFVTAWADWDETGTFLPDGWAKSIDYWIGAGLPRPVLLDCLTIARGNRAIANHAVFAYMGGIARKRIEDLHDSAKALMAVSDGT